MKELLLADANRLSVSASEYEATRQKINAARALVYGVAVRLQAEVYQPVQVIFSQDRSHLYPWGQLTS